jgi:FkbM family methyltransferase
MTFGRVAAPRKRSSDFAVPGEGALAACRRVPWSFRLARLLIRCRVRGGHRLLEATRRLGWLNRVVRYPLTDGIAIDIPLFRDDNCRDMAEIGAYESDLMGTLRRILATLSGPVAVIDGGADIGLFTMRLVAENTNVTSVFALEPNGAAYPWLCRNLGMLPIKSHPIHAAVGETESSGDLRNTIDDPSEHAKYVSPSGRGDVHIVRIDDVYAPDPAANLLLKLDVEGAELAALRGARIAIAQARRAIVVFEAHPRVAARTGIDPVECLRLLAGLRPFDFFVAERPGVRLSPGSGTFEQLGHGRNFNVVAVSRDSQAGAA